MTVTRKRDLTRLVRLEQWREKAIAGIDASLKERKGDPVKAELDIAMKRIGELIMQVELLEAKTRPALGVLTGVRLMRKTQGSPDTIKIVKSLGKNNVIEEIYVV